MRPAFVNAQNRTVDTQHVPIKKVVFSKEDDTVIATEKYMKENGTDAFRDQIDKVTTPF